MVFHVLPWPLNADAIQLRANLLIEIKPLFCITDILRGSKMALAICDVSRRNLTENYRLGEAPDLRHQRWSTLPP